MKNSVFLLGCLALVCAMGCAAGESSDAYMVFKTEKRAFTVTIDTEGELDAKTAQTLMTPRVRARPTIAYLADEGARVKQGDVVVVFEVEQLVKDYRNALDELEIARAELKQKQADLTLQRLMLESEMRNANAAAATSRLQLPKLEFAAPRMREIQELEMKKSEIQSEKIRKKLVSLEGIEKEELTHLGLKITQAENKVNQSKMFLDRLALTAPVDGIVVRTTNWSTDEKMQEGDIVYGGWPVVKIPDLSVMQVNAMVGETEAQRLKTGQRATVTVTSLNNLQLPGTVKSIANVAKPIRRNSKVKKVDIVVEIDSTHANLVPGLTALCRIVVEEIEEAMIVPFECVFDQDSLKVAYIRQDDAFVAREVKVVQQGADFAVITEGLREGDTLALRKPDAGLVRRE